MAVKRGLLAGGQITHLTRYIAFPKALEFLMFGDHTSAAEAEQIGIVPTSTCLEDTLRNGSAFNVQRSA